MRLQKLRGLDGVGERNRAAQGPNRSIAGALVLWVLQRAPAADDLGRVGEIDLAAAGRKVPLQRSIHMLLGHGEDHDLVVGQ